MSLKKNRSRVSLRNRMILIILIPMITVVLVVSLTTINSKVQNERASILKQLTSLAYLYNQGLIGSETISDGLLLQEYFNEEILDLSITSKERLYKEFDLSDVSENDFIFIGEKDPDMHTVSAINSTHYVHLFLSSDGINQRVKKYSFFILLLNLGGLITSLLIINLYMKSTVIEPIQSLRMATAAISNGDLDTRIEAKTINAKAELGDLANSFEKMRVQIKQSRKKILEKSQAKIEKAHREVDQGKIQSQKLRQDLIKLLLLSKYRLSKRTRFYESRKEEINKAIEDINKLISNLK